MNSPQPSPVNPYEPPTTAAGGAPQADYGSLIRELHTRGNRGRVLATHRLFERAYVVELKMGENERYKVVPREEISRSVVFTRTLFNAYLLVISGPDGRMGVLVDEEDMPQLAEMLGPLDERFFHPPPPIRTFLHLIFGLFFVASGALFFEPGELRIGEIAVGAGLIALAIAARTIRKRIVFLLQAVWLTGLGVHFGGTVLESESYLLGIIVLGCLMGARNRFWQYQFYGKYGAN